MPISRRPNFITEQIGQFPRMVLYEEKAAADARLWDISVDAGVFSIRLLSDDDATSTTVFNATRSGTSLVSLGLGGALATPLIIGGTAVSSDLVLQSTTGIGDGTDTVIVRVGNNGTITAGTFSATGLTLANADAIRFRNAADSADLAFGLLNSSDNLLIGNTTSELIIDANTSINFNDRGGDVDFKVKSDTNALAFIIDGAGNGNVGIGLQGWGTSAMQVLGIGTGTAPSTSPADMIQIFSVDLSAGNATVGIRTETAVAADAAVASTHTLRMVLNGVSYRVMLAT